MYIMLMYVRGNNKIVTVKSESSLLVKDWLRPDSRLRIDKDCPVIYAAVDNAPTVRRNYPVFEFMEWVSFIEKCSMALQAHELDITEYEKQKRGETMMATNEQETIEDLNRAYTIIGKEFFNNGNKLVGEKRDKAYMYVYFDIARALTKAADFDKAVQRIEDILKQCRHQDIVKRWVDIEGAKKDALIRRDWGSAFRKVKNGYELSGAIDYGFSREDISNLAKLHKSGKFRKKIEDLLEDCNFHTECADFSEKKYDEYIIEE